MGVSVDEKHEIDEARATGARALSSLRKAKSQLESARNWGMFDILAGGLVTSLVKRSKLDEASEAVDAARRDLARFSDELDDVSGITGVDLRRDGLLEFLDIFCDNALSDLLVQSRIDDACSAVDRAIHRVTAILAELGTKGAGAS